MRHPFLGAIAARLTAEGIATLRYQFPYMEAGRRRPDPPHLLQAAVRSAVETASELLPGIPLIAGGKSLGGRMSSNAAAEVSLAGVVGLAFLGFPLHPPGRPGDGRARHLDDVSLPMLFLQGTRDAFARLDLLNGVCERLGSRASLRLIEGGDHSFSVLKRSGRTSEEVLDELAAATSSWIDGLL
jgi:predicted alpha/beta-hydrolase family hydrolase